MKPVLEQSLSSTHEPNKNTAAKKRRTRKVIAYTVGAAVLTVGLFVLAKKLKSWLPEEELYE